MGSDPATAPRNDSPGNPAAQAMHAALAKQLRRRGGR
jgi:hypothetical protein